MTYIPTGPDSIQVTSINGWISPAFLSELFLNSLKRDAVLEFLCDVLEGQCNDPMDPDSTWQFNAGEFSTQQECKTKYGRLPTTSDGTFIAKNVLGCKVLHADLARSNSKHCAHASFLPQADSDTSIKCQDSVTLQSQVVDPTFFIQIAAFLGYDPTTVYSENCEGGGKSPCDGKA